MKYSFVLPSDERNITEFYQRLFSTINLNHLNINVLGEIENFPILYMERKVKEAKRKILIGAGFHGEEPGGPWGLLNFLETGIFNDFKSTNVSFLPIVNPTGMVRGKRRNIFNENPNSGFCHNEKDNSTPSYEGKILIENINMLLGDGLDGFISLHEDWEEENFYLYTFENSGLPGTWSYKLRDILSRYFNPVKDGITQMLRVKSMTPLRN